MTAGLEWDPRFELCADGIPKQRYTSPQFARLEAERLWTRTWQMACRLEEIPEPGFKFSRPEARLAQEARVARGEGRAIQLREPEKPKAAAATAAGTAAGEEVEILSERKLRARRMKAERDMKEYQDRGEEVPAEVMAAVEKYRAMKPDEPYGGGAAVAPA